MSEEEEGDFGVNEKTNNFCFYERKLPTCKIGGFMIVWTYKNESGWEN